MSALVNYGLIDPNLTQGVMTKGYNAYIDRGNALANQERANKLADLQYNQAMDAENQRRALQSFMANKDPNAPDFEQGLGMIVGPQGVMDYRTKKAAAGKAEFEFRAKKDDFLNQFKRNASADPSGANLAKWRDIAVREGFYSAEEADDTVEQLLQMPIEERVRVLSQAGASPGELKPSTIQVNRGGQTDVAQVPAFGGAPTTIGTYADVLSEKDRADLADKASQRSLAERRFAAEEAARIPKDDPRLVVANTITDSAGNVTQYNKFGEPIGDVKKGVGKPSATYEKTKALQKQMGIDLGRAITELETITKPGGLIEQSTGSGIGRATDTAAGFFGMATPGAIAIGKLKPIADLTLKMVPRFEGPQSDKDTQSYKEAAGQLADASLPTDIRLAAAKEVLRLMKSRQAQFVTSDMATEGLSPTSVDSSNPLLK